MPTWIALTIAAAFLQNLRSALQRQLARDLSPLAATYVRFSFGLPVAFAYLMVLASRSDAQVPAANAAFLAYCLVGGGAQVIATLLLVSLFAHRNFAVATTWSKTETVQAALFSIVILGEHLSVGAAIGILVSLAGVVAISIARTDLTARNLAASLTARPALMGLGSGAAFGVAAVCYRGAALSLGTTDYLMAAGFTLAVVLAIQTAALSLWLVVRAPDQLRAALRAYRVSAVIGIAGAFASACWFTAMALENAALVRAVGQIELVFTFVSSHVFFGERISRLEVAGILLVTGGIVVLLLDR